MPLKPWWKLYPPAPRLPPALLHPVRPALDPPCDPGPYPLYIPSHNMAKVMIRFPMTCCCPRR